MYKQRWLCQMRRDELFHLGSKCWSRRLTCLQLCPMTCHSPWPWVAHLPAGNTPAASTQMEQGEAYFEQVESCCFWKSGDNNFLHWLQKGCLSTFSTGQLVLGRDCVFRHLLYKSEMLALFSMGKGKGVNVCWETCQCVSVFFCVTGDIWALTFLHGWVLEVWMERKREFKEFL